MNNYQKLCIKSITGNITDAERKILDEWIILSEKNQSEFVHLNNIWNKGEIIKQPLQINIDKDWEEIQFRINDLSNYKPTQNEIELTKSLKYFTKFELLWKPALIVSILIIVSIVILFTVGINKDVELLSISTFGEKKNLILSDNSTVLLNKNSSIEYPENFTANERRIKLKGEAFFTIKKDLKPFVIETENAIVAIKGTELNVKSLSNITQVFVKEGKVDFVSSSDSESRIELKSGQLSFIEGKNKPTMPVHSAANVILNWVSDEFIFDSKPLIDIAEELENRYNINIDLDEKLFDERITGMFKADNPDSVIAMICLTLTAKYEKTPDRYVIKKY